MISAGQRLQEERLRRNLTLEKVSSATKIKKEFLESIESENYKNLPHGYALGFVRNYAKFLGLSEKEIVAFFRREYDVNSEISVVPKTIDSPSGIGNFKVKRGMFLVLGIFLLLFVYIAYQYRAALVNPSVSVYQPKDNSQVSGPTIEIIGKTEPDSTVLVNKEDASVDENGNFRKQIILFTGKTTIEVIATNRFGRKTTIMRHIDVKAAY